MSGSFQEARLSVDQIVRDFNQSGYPGLGMFSVKPADTSQYAVGPVAWDPGYPRAVQHWNRVAAGRAALRETSI